MEIFIRVSIKAYPGFYGIYLQEGYPILVFLRCGKRTSWYLHPHQETMKSTNSIGADKNLTTAECVISSRNWPSDIQQTQNQEVSLAFLHRVFH